MTSNGDSTVSIEDTVTTRTELAACLDIQNLNLFYGEQQVLFDLSLSIPKQRVTAIIGPSGCGKSTLLCALNRMTDLIDGCRLDGLILYKDFYREFNDDCRDQDILDPQVDVFDLRRRIGMVFQNPNPFPKSVYDNVAYGLRAHGISKRRIVDEAVEWALRSVALWDEVKDRLHVSALALSGGQQQRLVIARTIAIRPQILLLDEPASALDPISTLKIEELLNELKKQFSVVLVTHNLQQAGRISDYTAFIERGQLVEFADTDTFFTNPRARRTENYITGRCG